MPNLQPMLLLRTDTRMSHTAVALREAGYLVTRAENDEEAMRVAAMAHFDAMVVDLPLTRSAELLRGLRRNRSGIPVLVRTPAPQLLGRAFPGVEVIGTDKTEEDLVSATDLMIARHEVAPSLMAQAM